MAKLEALRHLMAERGLHAYIVPSGDEHQSEYIAPYAARRAYISGFTGSAGTAVIARTEAALWTDGRYFLQAEEQLDPKSDWKLMKAGLSNTPTISGYLKTSLPPSSVVGVDPRLISEAESRNIQIDLEEVSQSLVGVPENLIDLIWKDHPSVPLSNVFIHPLKFAGTPSKQKISELRAHMKERRAHVCVIAALDEIMWLLNVRGCDIPFNPVVISYLVVTLDHVYWFVDSKKLKADILPYLEENLIKVLEYSEFFPFLKSVELPGNTVTLIHESRCSMAIFQALRDRSEGVIFDRSNFVTEKKSIKTENELQGLRECHVRDAVAVVRYFAFLESHFSQPNAPPISEYEGAQKLEAFRKCGENFFSLSFDTISSSGPNGAIIHYKPDESKCATISQDALYLCDSGAQYLDGTTDVTRTIHFGVPKDHEKVCYTLVLKGHISLDSIVFPEGTLGFQLDLLARQHLWKFGLDYRHGTGHGVGAFLNVHEGPHGISFRLPSERFPLRPGMTVTNEPGYYEDGNFGIRIEDVVVVTRAETPFQFGGPIYLRFENITRVPINTKMIDVTLLEKSEIEWVNQFNQRCLDTLSPLLHDPMERKWLEKECAPI